MSKLIFDIETRGQKPEEMDEVIKSYLVKDADNDEEKEIILTRTGLFPISGEIVAIAMLNPETNQGKVYFQADHQTENYTKNNIEYIVSNEEDILKKFWQDIKHFDLLVSYNGRGFDAPFIIFRSAYYNIKPTRNLMPNRYYKNEHLDLMDQLTFYGAFRKFSLEAMCQFLNIKNPKEQGVSGLEINNLYDNKEYSKIAEYCMRDVVATKELYKRVYDFLNF
ncbi:MAG: ribonuclease H-like domain-containing protein [Patescibacteria group bacterium]